jgi:outer membrane protein assembly factor BamC
MRQRATSLRVAGLCAALGLLSACSTTFDSEKVNYKSSASVKPVTLDVPPDLSQLARETRYAVPGGSVSATSLEATQKTQGSMVSPNTVGDVKMERSGAQRWLSVQRPADKVWPLVKDFWIENGFTYTLEQQNLGMLETEWAENRAKLPQDFIRKALGKVIDALYSTGERDKFKTRIESLNDNQTEIFISHRGMVEVYNNSDKTSTTWQPRPSDSALENEFLRRLMIRLGSSVEQANKALANEVVQPLAVLTTAAGKPLIELSASFDVAWRRVGVALDRTGFTVEDRDRRQGLYFVRYVDKPDEKKDSGFFSRLFSSSATAATPVRYRVRLSDAGNSTRISVLNAAGEEDSSPVAQRIAQLLVDDLK